MGIEVSAAKVVTINDQHENGVDTSIAGNPIFGKFKGITLIHVFSRNQKGSRRDDGNPLIHALKGRRGFSITEFWKGRLMARARTILASAPNSLEGFDYCLPMPSSSPFCTEFAAAVSAASGAPILDSSFLRKRTVGELLADIEANPPKVRESAKGAFKSQLHAWQGMDPTATYQAKDVNVALREHFPPFVSVGDLPDVAGKRVLVVDDVFATGTSLASVREIVQNQLDAQVSAIFFLSGV